MVSLALLLRPSTTPLENSFLALYFSGDLVTFATEYPANTNTPPGCQPPTISNFLNNCCHWDIQSSYSALDVTPATVILKVGDSMPVFPVAKDQIGDVITVYRKVAVLGLRADGSAITSIPTVDR
jgi:hypothetical protein